MKRIISILLCVLMLFSSMLFTSCLSADTTTPQQDAVKNPTVETLNGQTPIELYSATVENIEKATGIRFSTVLTMEVTTEGKEPTVFNQSVIVSTDHQSIYVQTASERHPETNAEIWFVGDTLYMTGIGGSFKQPLSLEEYYAKYAPDGSDPATILLDCPEAWFKDAEFTKEDLDSYYLEFELSGKEYWNKIKDGMMTSEIMSMAVKNVDYKVYFDEEGNLKEIVTEFEISFGHITTKYISTTKVELNAEVEISAPEGSDAWANLGDKLPEHTPEVQ